MTKEPFSFLGDWKPATDGERLLHFLVAEVAGFGAINSSALVCLAGIPRSQSFANFLHGVVVLHAFGRLIQAAKAYRERHVDDEKASLSLIALFLTDYMDISHATCGRFEELPALALDAARASSRNSHCVPRRTKQQVQDESRDAFCCYSCGNPLDPTDRRKYIPEPQGSGSLIRNNLFTEYEHIWPHSFGGNTTVDNLALSCQFCNEAKENLTSWEWALVQSLLPTADIGQPTLDHKHTKRSVKMSLHMKAAMLYARKHGTTLKGAMQTIGPREKSVTVIDTDDTPDFFNLRVHDEVRTGIRWDA